MTASRTALIIVLAGAGNLIALLGAATSLAASAEAGVPTSTSTSSSTFPPDFGCTVQAKVYDPVAVTSLFFVMSHFGAQNCSSDIPGVTVTEVFAPRYGLRVDGFPDGFRGPATIVECFMEFPHFHCPPKLDGEDIETWVYEAVGPDGAISPLPTICPARLDCTIWPCGPEGPYFVDVCGDTDANGVIASSDALFTLRAAINLETCAPTLCDADRSEAIEARDALAVLRAAVGLEVVLACPAPCVNTPFGS